MDRDWLEAAVARDLTVRQIACEAGCSYSTVRYWLVRHGLRTTATARRRYEPAARPGRFVAHCARHGRSEFVQRAEGGRRCVHCRAEQVSEWRRRMKTLLVEEAGGCCSICGYDRWVGALEFHHVDPSTKRFSIAGRGLARSLETLRAEARKCVLLCVNCHAEVEGGCTVLPVGE